MPLPQDCFKHATGMDGRRRDGFTLLEITLAISILVMLAALATVTIGRGYELRQFDEGVRRFESTLRMARVEASAQGRRFQISFETSEEGIPAMRVQWEAQPLTEPGQFTDYERLSTWAGYIPGDEIRIVSCRLIGASAYSMPGDEEEDESTLQSITFYPDGSSDSALVELALPGQEDDAELRTIVRLDGINATVLTIVVTDDELQENLADIERGLYVPETQTEGDDE